MPPGPVTLHLEGGDLLASVTPALDVVLRGPVEEVCEGHLTDAFVEALAAEAQAS